MSTAWIITLCLACAGAGIACGLRFGWVIGYRCGYQEAHSQWVGPHPGPRKENRE